MTEREPMIWLNQGEAAGEATCGCLLDSDYDESGMPAFILCPLHVRAPELLADNERLRAQLATLREAATEAADYIGEMGHPESTLDKLRAALARTEGGD